MSSHRASSTASAAGGGDPQGFPAAAGLTHYQLLELSPAASATELRQAFRSLSKRFHPDTTTLPASEAREAFARLRQAYAVLADPVSRRAYDAALRRPPELPLVPPLPSAPVGGTPIGVRRSLSGGEWFALVLLALALALSLVLGVGLAWARGAALIVQPSWWTDPSAPAAAAAAMPPPAAAIPAPTAPEARPPEQAPQPAGISQAR